MNYRMSVPKQLVQVKSVVTQVKQRKLHTKDVKLFNLSKVGKDFQSIH